MKQLAVFVSLFVVLASLSWTEFGAKTVVADGGYAQTVGSDYAPGVRTMRPLGTVLMVGVIVAIALVVLLRGRRKQDEGDGAEESKEAPKDQDEPR